MFRRILSLTLIALLLNLTFHSTAKANTNLEKEAKFAAKVKTNIAKLGTGKDAKVKIKLKDGTKLKGYLSEVKDSSFVLTSDTVETSSEISYSQVKQVKGNNLSKGVRIALAIGVILAIGLFYGILLSDDD